MTIGLSGSLLFSQKVYCGNNLIKRLPQSLQIRILDEIIKTSTGHDHLNEPTTNRENYRSK